MTTKDRVSRGRPRAFDTDEVLQRSMLLFWRHGFNATTMRTLEDELGISQSSLYNAFGSKEQLFGQTIAYYERRLDEVVLSHLDRPEPDRDAIIDFLSAVLEWISQEDHPGCLVLNYASESQDGLIRMRAYRARLRELFRPALRTFTNDAQEVETRTELLVAAVLGLNISASSGTDPDELEQLTTGIKHQVTMW